MKVSELNENELTAEMIDKVIYSNIEEAPDIPGDCIMVLGSQKAPEYRVPKAVQLYENRQAPKILMCGGRELPTVSGPVTEAKLMRLAAVRANVPANDILLEEFSLSTKENMICAALVLDRTFQLCNIKEILLVTANYHMQRSLAMARTYMPQWIHFIPCPAYYAKADRTQWFQTAAGGQLLENEAKKIISYIREGSIPDFEI